MDLPLLGAGAAGVIVGWLVYFCLVKFDAVNINTLLKILGAIFAGVVWTFLIKGLKADSDALAVYALGVLVGMVLFFILKAIGVGPTINEPS
jgi:hypothetical protein